MASKFFRIGINKLVPLVGLCFTMLVLMSVISCGPPREEPTPTPIPLSSPTPTLDKTRVVESTPTSAPLEFVKSPLKSMPLSGEWRFKVDPERQGMDSGWSDLNFDDSAWQTVTVPHTWNVMPEYWEYEGFSWYRKTFSVPTDSEGAYHRLRFQAVFYEAHVWLNGVYLGAHEGGYAPFEFDVSALVKPGTDNIIAVQVDNMVRLDRIPAKLRANWSFDWWNYGGIVRDVSLEISSNILITNQQIVAIPQLVAENQAVSTKITTEVNIYNASKDDFEGLLSAELFDESTGLSVHMTPPSIVSIAARKSAKIQMTVTLEDPMLWHFDHPNLYSWSTNLLTEDGQILHTKDDNFGVRLVEVKEAQFYLNGEPVRLAGLTRHADSPEHGLAETVTVMAADYDDMKRLNMVFSRPVHYPQAEFILDYCDRNGILLIPEVPAWQLTSSQMADPGMQALEQQQLGEMVLAAFNHPSVWAWSVGNEIDSRSDVGHSFVREMVAYVKSLDPTRPVGFASNHLNVYPQGDATEFSDFVLMNQYIGTWAGPKQDLAPALDKIHETWPDRVVIVSEYGFEPRWNRWGPPTGSLDPEEYYFISDSVPPDSDKADEQRQQVIEDQMEVFRSKPFVVGAIFWTYQDYRTRTNFIMGVVDGERKRRGSWYVLREEYSPVLIESMNYLGAESGKQTAVVKLKTRGPIEVDMPAYTLRDYHLYWSVGPRYSETVYSEGEISLPTLEPGSEWEGEIEFNEPVEDYVLNLQVVRPTGFSVIERTYDPDGEMLPGE